MFCDVIRTRELALRDQQNGIPVRIMNSITCKEQLEIMSQAATGMVSSRSALLHYNSKRPRKGVKGGKVPKKITVRVTLLDTEAHELEKLSPRRCFHLILSLGSTSLINDIHYFKLLFASTCNAIHYS